MAHLHGSLNCSAFLAPLRCTHSISIINAPQMGTYNIRVASDTEGLHKKQSRKDKTFVYASTNARTKGYAEKYPPPMCAEG